MIERLYEIFRQGAAISTDSRSVGAGDLFFALRGDRFDGNKYAQQALDQGASCAVVSDRALSGEHFLYVPDTLVALQQLAMHHRDQLDIPVLGITGSNGKTTTKELIAAVLSARYNVFATRGNLNNHIGVPLSVLSIGPDIDFAVIEMGANHVGEIAALCKIAKPSCGLITNIGKAHIEGFGGVEGVIRGKGELFQWLEANQGMAIFNPGLAHLSRLAKPVGKKWAYVIGDEPGFQEGIISMTADPRSGISLTCHDRVSNVFEVRSQLFGTYNMLNVAAAVAIGLIFEVPAFDISGKVGGYVSENNRSQVVHIGGNTIVMDAYNANPTSMELTIASFAKLAGPRYLILGEMRELGDTAKAEHDHLLQSLRDYEWEAVILIGKQFGHCELESGERWFVDTAAAREALRTDHIQDARILLKGSRSNALETLLEVWS